MEKFTKTRRRLVHRNYSNKRHPRYKPHQIRRMRRLNEDYKENSALLCINQAITILSCKKKRETLKH